MKIKWVALFLSIGCIACAKDPEDSPVPDDKPDPVPVDESIPANFRDYAVKDGYQIPFYEGTTAGSYGYYLFIPENYEKSEKLYPLILMLHGSGERGTSKDNPGALELAVVHGPGKLIKEGVWNPKQEFVVVSAQTNAYLWSPETLKEFISFLSSTHKIDPERIYMTGLSMGAYGIFDYLGQYGKESGIAAAVPICGRGLSRDNYVRNVSQVPIWVFHGESDPNVPVERAHEIVSAINSLNPKVKAKMTLFPYIGHDSWTMTYDGSGMGKENPAYDRFDQDIYTWLYQYTVPE